MLLLWPVLGSSGTRCRQPICGALSQPTGVARAAIAFFIPRRLAICIAQALSQDHYAPIPRHPARRPHRIGTDRQTPLLPYELWSVAGEIALRIASLAVLVAAPSNRRTRVATQVRAVALSGIGLAGISQPCLGSDEIHSVKALAK